jgi:toxin-antitoxin system PIN domain toxin
MLIDANLLLYAANQHAPEYERAGAWLETQLNGTTRVGIPWESLIAFLRVSTHPRSSPRPLTADEAWAIVAEWLASPTVWVPVATDRHAEVLGGLIARYRLVGNMVSDAQLAALAIQHGLEVCSADTDFARFTEIRWRNPMAEG